MVNAVIVALVLVLLGTAAGLIFYARRWSWVQEFYIRHSQSVARISLTKGRIIYCNMAFALNLGYDSRRDCLADNDLLKHFPKLDFERVIQRLLGEGSPVESSSVTTADTVGGQFRLSFANLRSGQYADMVIEALPPAEHLAEEGSERTRLKRLHDLANHLAAISGYAQLISADAEPRFAEYASRIQIGVDQINQLVNGQVNEPAPRAGSGLEIIKKICDEMGVTLISQIRSSVRLQEDILELALRVSVENSLAVTSADQVVVRSEYGENDGEFCSSCGVELSESLLKISVVDRGSGISRDHFERLMSQGFSTSEVGNVSGQGLATLDKRLHENQGHIVIDSSIQGCRVSIYLPNPATPSRSATSLSSRILIIDDEPLVRDYLSEVLRNNGLQVTALGDPFKAIEAFRRHSDRFDLVITDQHMPGMSGSGVFERLRDIRPDLPIILCSGYNEHKGEELVDDLGASGFVKKPIDVNQLLILIGSILESQEA